MTEHARQTDTLKSFLESFAQRVKHRETCGRPEDPAPFVTISRQSGAGGTTVARRLIERLNELNREKGCRWSLFDKELIHEVAEEHHLPAEMEKFLTEQGVSEIRDMVESFLELHPPAFALVKKTSETILRLAHGGHCVIVGRGAPIVTLGLPGGMHIRLIGSEAKRTRHLQDLYGIAPQEAARRMRDQDKGRKDYVKQNFSRDIEDPLLYDWIINTDRVSPDHAAELIAAAVMKVKTAVER